jgi:hypothetical protein
VEIIDNPRDDKWSEASPAPFMVRSSGPKPKIRELFEADEIDLLRLFEHPRVFGEELFQCPELDRVDDPRGFLARCLRLGILTDQHGG